MFLSRCRPDDVWPSDASRPTAKVDFAEIFAFEISQLWVVFWTFAAGLVHRHNQLTFPRWLAPVADDGSTKGVFIAIPVVYRRYRSNSAPHQADLAIENPAHRPIRVLRAHPGFRGTHLS